MSIRILGGTLGAALLAGLLVAGCTEENNVGNPANVATSGVALSATEVDQILTRAISEANRRGLPAAIAVTDREGEVLGVFLMNGRDINGDNIIDTPGAGNVEAAIAKAATAAAFQSEGEAFTTRTAYFIVQGHYPPDVEDTGGGPLFGVQDSGMGSSDSHIIAYGINEQLTGTANAVGTGVSGVFGGVPLYKQGSPVGGIGVDTVAAVVSLSFPNNQNSPQSPTLVTKVQKDSDEAIARAGAGVDFDAPSIIDAHNVFVDGVAFPMYLNSANFSLATIASSVSGISAGVGDMVAEFPVRASPLTAEVRVDKDYGLRSDHRLIGRLTAPESATFTGTLSPVLGPGGVPERAATVAIASQTTLRFTGVPIVPLTQRTVPQAAGNSGGRGEVRNFSIDSISPTPAQGGLTASQVTGIIDNAVRDAASSVAGIRLPRGSHVHVHVAVVDRRGNLLGLFRMADGTLFSSDIAVQKARTCAFFSSDGSGGVPALAVTARAIGFLAQPFFPPGIDGTNAGPLVNLRDIINRGKIPVEIPPSLTIINPPTRAPSDGTTDENPLVGGFQTFNDFPGGAPAELAAVRALLGAAGGITLTMDRPDTVPTFVSPGLQSGLMTFPGAVPLYNRNGTLIGAVGVSGDGVDEDDSASFAGAQGFLPPTGIRIDEADESTIRTVLQAKVDVLVAAIQGHPDLRIRNVYGPIMARERTNIRNRLAQGFDSVRIPYIKLPRNPRSF